jgi:hypothetical protein
MKKCIPVKKLVIEIKYRISITLAQKNEIPKYY